MNDFYSIVVLLHVVFSPPGVQSPKETVAIAGIYDEVETCLERRETFTLTSDNPNGKYGCVEVVHPADMEKLLRKEEGSH